MKELFILLDVPENVLGLLPETNLLIAVSGVFSDLTDIGILVILLCFMAFIGGEQKKKSLTIPLSKGLRIESYVISKFTLFPLLGFFSGLIFSLVGYYFSLALFGNGIAFINVISSSLLVGFEVMFAVTLCTSIGLITSQPGIGVAIIYVSRLILTSILAAADINRFNPYALNLYASMFNFAPLLEVIISVIITFILIIFLFVFTMIVMKKRVLKLAL
jgi:hypothetical protein